MSEALAVQALAREARFYVPGKPQTAGSKRPVAGKRKDGSVWARAVEGEDHEAAERKTAWRTDIQAAARDAGVVKWPDGAPLDVRYVFVRRRPSNHLGTGRNAGVLKDWARDLRPATRPDALKLARAAEDALTDVAWADDSTTVGLRVDKAYGDQVGLGTGDQGLIVVIRDARPYGGPRLSARGYNSPVPGEGQEEAGGMRE